MTISSSFWDPREMCAVSVIISEMINFSFARGRKAAEEEKPIDDWSAIAFLEFFLLPRTFVDIYEFSLVNAHTHRHAAVLQAAAVTFFSFFHSQRMRNDYAFLNSEKLPALLFFYGTQCGPLRHCKWEGQITKLADSNRITGFEFLRSNARKITSRKTRRATRERLDPVPLVAARSVPVLFSAPARPLWVV